MPKCVFKKCQNNTIHVQKKDGVSYFHFPRNEMQQEKWRRIVARDREDEFYKSNTSSVICSEHFCKEDMYLTKKGFTRIKKTAVPNLPVNTEPSDVAMESEFLFTQDEIEPADLGTEEIKIASSVTGTLESPSTLLSTTNLNMHNTTINPNTQLAESRSALTPYLTFYDNTLPVTKSPSPTLSIGSILDTPYMATIKKDLKLCKSQLLNKTRKVKNLQRINNRLKKRNTNLKTIVTAVKKKRRLLDASVFENLSSHAEVRDIFKALFLKNVKKKRSFSQYPPGARKFALTLHFHSPPAYRYIRKLFHNCLPHSNTLLQWFKSVDAKPGSTISETLRLKQKSQSANKEII